MERREAQLPAPGSAPKGGATTQDLPLPPARGFAPPGRCLAPPAPPGAPSSFPEKGKEKETGTGRGPRPPNNRASERWLSAHQAVIDVKLRAQAACSPSPACGRGSG